MILKSIAINDSKIGLLSDLHWGKSRDSIVKLDATDKVIDNFIDLLKKENIKTFFFLGDWYDNRNTISVKTINYSYSALKKISNAGISAYILIGNHDSYLKESIKLNSVDHHSDIPNITIISEPTVINFQCSNKRALLYPWKSLEEIDEKYDLMFGHLDFQRAELAGNVNRTGFEGDDLTSKIPLIFSGHFHIRKEYTFKHGKIITVGCPLPLDWGDYGNIKGFHVLDLKSYQYDFFPNNFSPQYIKLYWSKIKNKQETFTNITGNYIKLVIDEKYKFDNIMKIINFVNSRKPIKNCETEFIYNIKFCNPLGDLIKVDDDVINITKRDYIMRFIHTHEEQIKNLDKDKLQNLVYNYYNELAEINGE